MANRSKAPRPDAPTLAEWRALAEGELRGRTLASLDRPTSEGITLKPLYTASDLEEITAAGFPWREALPGVPPYQIGRASCRERV